MENKTLLQDRYEVFLINADGKMLSFAVSIERGIVLLYFLYGCFR